MRSMVVRLIALRLSWYRRPAPWSSNEWVQWKSEIDPSWIDLLPDDLIEITLVALLRCVSRYVSRYVCVLVLT